jgi:hypothetical protein
VAHGARAHAVAVTAHHAHHHAHAPAKRAHRGVAELFLLCRIKRGVEGAQGWPLRIDVGQAALEHGLFHAQPGHHSAALARLAAFAGGAVAFVALGDLQAGLLPAREQRRLRARQRQFGFQKGQFADLVGIQVLAHLAAAHHAVFHAGRRCRGRPNFGTDAAVAGRQLRDHQRFARAGAGIAADQGEHHRPGGLGGMGIGGDQGGGRRAAQGKTGDHGKKGFAHGKIPSVRNLAAA